MDRETPFKTQQVSNRRILVKSLFSFAVLLIFLCAAWFTYNKIAHQPPDKGTPATLRKALNKNEEIFSGIFDTARTVKEYPLSAAAKIVRVNGREGLRDSVDEASWRLNVVRSNGDTLHITLDDIKKLPKKDIVFNFKCIEGWSQVSHWAGVPFKTFMQHYNLTNEAAMKYVGLQTPGNAYYVGIDMPSALQSQTILCYEMNGKPLPTNQGFPLRLIIPVKYGIKHLKRIGTMYFSNTKPPDYWAERGYDYYAGH